MPQDAAQYEDRLYNLRWVLRRVIEEDDLYLSAETPEKVAEFTARRALEIARARKALKAEIEAMGEDEPEFDELRKLLGDL
jgi:hypothetical protein